MDSWLERNSLTLLHPAYIKTMYQSKIKYLNQFSGVKLIRSSVEKKYDLVDHTQFIFKENFAKSLSKDFVISFSFIEIKCDFIY